MAAVEFALVLPLLMTAVFMGLETGWLVLQQQMVGRITAQTADNVSRIRDSIDETDIYETLAAAKLNAERIGSLNRSRIVISSFQLNAAGNGQWLRWQRCLGELSGGSIHGIEGAGQTDKSIPTIKTGTRSIQALAGMAIIVVETKHIYRPLISDKMFGERTLTADTAYIVRQRNDLGINNATALPESKKLKC